jgi:endonuclease I
MKKVIVLLLSLFCIASANAGATLSELLITEVVVTPTDGEFIEIHNRGGSIIDLSDVYLTDATVPGSAYYYNVVTGSNYGGGASTDFLSRFPSGASISPGEYQTIAMTGSTAFFSVYGVNPTYELFEDDGAPDAIPDMLEAIAGSINGQGGLSNGGEVVIMFYWDGSSDLVQDLDYFLWGDKVEAVDKTGISIDGPDADAIASAYLNDTVTASQDVVNSGAHSFGNSWQRTDMTEGTETQSGGNGIAGSNETSENLSATFTESVPTPNAAYTPPPPDYGALLITEISVLPTEGEFVEIHNNGLTTIDLTDVYITDATYAGGGTYYYQIVTGGGGGGGFADFNARFPAGATIAAGEYQTIALNGSTNFNTTYGVDPTYELYEDGGVADAIPDMLEAVAGSINGQGGLSGGTNDGEVLILYTWDGMSDLVMDIDYALWGDRVEAVDKTGVSIDGPDADPDTSTYLDDILTTNQAVISANAHASGNTWQRSDLTEGVEIQTGGNGVDGSNETSEDTNNTFFEGLPSPNAASVPPPPSAPNVIINEVDAVSGTEFIELYGTVNASLTDVTVVLYQGSDDTIYDIIDLSGLNMGSDGYFLIGDSSLTPEVTISANTLHDDASAVAIYFSNASNFTIGGSLTTTDLMDALVYDSGQADDAELLTLLNAGQAQIDENNNSNAATESNARCPNGSGGSRNTATYNQVSPTPAAVNNSCPLEDYYASVDPTNATTLRNTLHDIIKVAISFPYSNGASQDTWEILSFADEDHNTAVDVNPNVSEAVWMVYKNNSYTYNGGGQQPYNREHTWPQSRGFHEDDMGTDNSARTDAHHLMMSDKDYNYIRNNKYYDNCDPSNDVTCTNNVSAGDDTNIQTIEYSGTVSGPAVGGNTGSTYPGNSNWTNNSVFEVWNFRKGDIARAMFYMDVRYEASQMDPASSPPQMEPDLILTNDVSQLNAGGPYMGLLSTLLEWHTLDPVDDIERERNEVVYSYQQNRNPFIDHPEWVECIFQDICPDDLIFENGFE